MRLLPTLFATSLALSSCPKSKNSEPADTHSQCIETSREKIMRVDQNKGRLTRTKYSRLNHPTDVKTYTDFN